MPEISCLCMHFKDLSKVANKYTISMSQTKCTIETHVLPTATDKESLYANMNHMNVVPPRSSSQNSSSLIRLNYPPFKRNLIASN
eukprot:scaffold3701_cov192-Alexandrium_tamarense.AAC.20